MSRLINYESHKTLAFLSMGHADRFLPGPVIDPDIGAPFDYVPDAAGVIALLDFRGHALCIEACKSMRKRLTDHYMGFEGKLTVSPAFFAYEACAQCEMRELQLLEEHRSAYGYVPKRNRA